MKTENVYKTLLRLNLDIESNRKAYEYIKSKDTLKYPSITNYLVSAILALEEGMQDSNSRPAISQDHGFSKDQEKELESIFRKVLQEELKQELPISKADHEVRSEVHQNIENRSDEIKVDEDMMGDLEDMLGV